VELNNEISNDGAARSMREVSGLDRQTGLITPLWASKHSAGGETIDLRVTSSNARPNASLEVTDSDPEEVALSGNECVADRRANPGAEASGGCYRCSAQH
jgi:hypothetical protein